MDKFFKIIVCVVFILSVLFIAGCSSTNTSVNYDAFAKCMTDKGVAMYGTEWCPHCKDQKKLFGESFQYVNFVDCDKSKAVCDSKGVNAYPTWRINGNNYLGKYELIELANLTGCSLSS